MLITGVVAIALPGGRASMQGEVVDPRSRPTSRGIRTTSSRGRREKVWLSTPMGRSTRQKDRPLAPSPRAAWRSTSKSRPRGQACPGLRQPW